MYVSCWDGTMQMLSGFVLPPSLALFDTWKAVPQKNKVLSLLNLGEVKSLVGLRTQNAAFFERKGPELLGHALQAVLC